MRFYTRLTNLLKNYRIHKKPTNGELFQKNYIEAGKTVPPLYFLDLKEKIHLGTIQIEPSSFKTDLLSISQ